MAAELRKIGDKVSSAKADKNLSSYQQVATNQHPTVLNDGTTASGKTPVSPPSPSLTLPAHTDTTAIRRFMRSALESVETTGMDDDFGTVSEQLGLEWRNIQASGTNQKFGDAGLKLVDASGNTVSDGKGNPIARSFKDAENLVWEMDHPYVPPTNRDMVDVYARIKKHFPSNGFMERIAIQESHEGTHKDTGRSLYYGGVFQVEEGTFLET
ncbi:MAG: hypothetical protein VCE74_19955 [Alphaproteobacteria bacterium]